MRLWFQHLLAVLKEMGFTQSQQDQCLLYKKDCLVIVYVDDVGVTAPTPDLIDNIVAYLKQHGFELPQEGSFSEYLGIKFEENQDDGTIMLTQKGLIKKILQATGMQDCSLIDTPLLLLPSELTQMDRCTMKHSTMLQLSVCSCIF